METPHTTWQQVDTVHGGFVRYLNEQSSTPPILFRARVLLRQGTSRLDVIKALVAEFGASVHDAKAIVDAEIKRLGGSR
jgi:hypothetical protein